MKSCLYVGTVHHRRSVPSHHAFRYPLFLTYLDLDELDSVFAQSPWWSINRCNLVNFKRQDFIGPHSMSVKEAVVNTLKQHGVEGFNGQVRMLASLRYFGFCFNPVTFYFCFREGEDEATYLIAEVHNTPWNEKHVYVLSFHSHTELTMPCMNSEAGRNTFEFAKEFHVSPFNPMSMQYKWSVQQPGKTLQVHIGAHHNAEKWFSASLLLNREPLTSRSMAGILIRFPLMTLKVFAGIYWQAFRLWIKRTPIFDHPVSSS